MLLNLFYLFSFFFSSVPCKYDDKISLNFHNSNLCFCFFPAIFIYYLLDFFQILFFFFWDIDFLSNSKNSLIIIIESRGLGRKMIRKKVITRITFASPKRKTRKCENLSPRKHNQQRGLHRKMQRCEPFWVTEAAARNSRLQSAPANWKTLSGSIKYLTNGAPSRVPLYPSIHPPTFPRSLLLGWGPHYENASVKPDISRTRYPYEFEILRLRDTINFGHRRIDYHF